MSQREDQLNAAEENLRSAENEAQRVISDATSQEESLKAKATREAEELVADARTKAERLRRDSERELAAVSQRRDSITAQLSNVRQMLATLGGGAAMVGADLDPVMAAEPAAEPVSEPDTATELEQESEELLVDDVPETGEEAEAEQADDVDARA